MNNLFGIDFNLIKYLDSLLRLKGVTLAAKEVGITQPAMSNALSRLRSQFDDQLLVKTGQGYELTVRAQEIQPQIQNILKTFETTFFHKREFNPCSNEFSFKVMISDTAGYVLAPKLMEMLHKKFPPIKVNFETYKDLSELQNYDLAITSSLIPNFSKYRHHELLKEPFAVAGCPYHFRKKSSLTLDDYLQETHYVVQHQGVDPDFIDIELAKMGKTRKEKVTLPHFSIAIKAIAHTPNLITLPKSILDDSSACQPIKTYQVPFDLPYLTHTLIWHEKYQNDPANSWLRDQIIGLFLDS